MNLYLKQLELGPMQNFVYLIGSADSKAVAVIDPAWDPPAILAAAKQDGMKITHAIVTHTHFDHINGIEELVEKTDAKVIVHKKEVKQLPLEKGSVQAIEGGATLRLGNVELTLLHTPGHSPGSICVTAQDRLLAGDTLFVSGCGRCDFEGGDPEVMYKSLTRLSQLDDQVLLYPGHNYAPQPTSSIGEEKLSNRFLKAKGLEAFLSVRNAT